MDGRTTACDAGASGKGFPRQSGNFLRAAGMAEDGANSSLTSTHLMSGWPQADLEPPERFDLASLGLAPEERITLGRFAALIGLARATVTQHRGRSGFPSPGGDGTYCAGDLLDYWNSRAGHRGQARNRRAGAAP